MAWIFVATSAIIIIAVVLTRAPGRIPETEAAPLIAVKPIAPM